MNLFEVAKNVKKGLTVLVNDNETVVIDTPQAITLVETIDLIEALENALLKEISLSNSHASHLWVKFSCGCIGTRPSHGKSQLIKICDGRSEENNLFFLYPRYMQESDAKENGPGALKTKEFEVLDNSNDELVGLLAEIKSLLSDGYKFRQIKDALS